MKTKLAVIFAIILLQSCKTQQVQTKTTFPKIENQIAGELDYTKGGFELVQWNKNGDEITMGTIDNKGNIHLNLPEYDIRALSKNQNKSSIQSQFNMTYCKEKGDYDMMGQAKFKTPYDDVYARSYPPMFIKKYGVSIAYISPVSGGNMIVKNRYDKVIGSKYYWVYIDRDLDYKDTCIKEYDETVDIGTDVSADIQFKKGWNFIDKNIVSIQTYGENEERTIPKKILFTSASPKSKDVKWYIERKMDEEKIVAAKKEYNSVTPSPNE